MGGLIGVRQEKPSGVHIKDVYPVVTANAVLFFGLGDDDVLYRYTWAPKFEGWERVPPTVVGGTPQ